MPAFLLSAEGILPNAAVTQERTLELALGHLESGARRQKLLSAVYEKVSVDTRHSVLTEGPSEASFDDFFKGRRPGTGERMAFFEKHAPRLAHDAARKALASAGVLPASIGHLVGVSCTGFSAPGFDLPLIPSLGLPPSVSRIQVGFMGCHGVFNGLRAAAALAADGRDALVVSVELCSLHYRNDGGSRQMLANALFADGAGAAVVSSRTAPWSLVAQASTVVPGSEDAITWRIGDEGFEMTLSPRVPQIISSSLRPWLTAWLGTHKLALSDVRAWAVHPGGPGVLDAVEEALSLSGEALAVSREVLRSHGNMSSAAILFILREMMKRPALPCVALGFGPGLTVEAALFR